MARGLGWSRRGSKRRFTYVDAAGKEITDEAKLERIAALAIPPAWKDVWIAPTARAKLQATGVDAAGRTQYLYHPAYRARQEQAKYDKLVRFAERLPELRQTMAEHMALDGLPPERVSAIAVRLINLGWFRVGSDRYAKASRTFGITTLRKSHVSIRGSRISFRYRGKHRILIRSAIVDPELAAALRELLALPGSRLFQFEIEGERVQPRQPPFERLYPRASGRGLHRQGFPDVGRHVAGGDRARRARSAGVPGRGEAADRGGDAEGRGEAREHPGGRALVLREPGGRRAVSRRENDRGFPAPPFTCRGRTGCRARRGGAGDAQPAAFVANSRGSHRGLNSV